MGSLAGRRSRYRRQAHQCGRSQRARRCCQAQRHAAAGSSREGTHLQSPGPCAVSRQASCRRLLHRMERQIWRRGMEPAGKIGRQARLTVETQSQAHTSANSGMIRAQFAAATIESRLGSVIEIVAGGLVVAEIAILFGGVISRYVFDRPLVWSDELASTLFLWLAMLGAVIAFRRDEHMRMTACVGMFSGSMRSMLDSVATAAALAFLLLMISPAYQFASDEVPITTSALQISDVWRAAALPSGIGLMIIFAVLRLARASVLAACLSIGIVAVVIALFWLGTP